jgi:hypothetical protein
MVMCLLAINQLLDLTHLGKLKIIFSPITKVKGVNPLNDRIVEPLDLDLIPIHEGVILRMHCIKWFASWK